MAPIVAAQDGAPAPWRAVIEQRVELPADPVGGRTPREVSALAWDAQRSELVAVSDRGRLWRYRLKLADGRLQVEPVLTARIDADAGTAANGTRAATGADSEEGTNSAGGAQHPGGRGSVDAEGLVWRPTGGGGELLVAGERAWGVMRLAADGRVLGQLPWPAGLQTLLGGRRPRVEALAWHPLHGLLVAPQNSTRRDPAGLQGAPPGAQEEQAPEPVQAPRRVHGDARSHGVHAASGARWQLAASGPRSQIKAIEVLADGSLLLLERVQPVRGGPHQSVLRWLDPASCGDDRACAAPPLSLTPAAAFGTDNQEGLACADDGRCWLVNDSGPGRGTASWLTPFRLLPR